MCAGQPDLKPFTLRGETEARESILLPKPCREPAVPENGEPRAPECLGLTREGVNFIIRERHCSTAGQTTF